MRVSKPRFLPASGLERSRHSETVKQSRMIKGAIHPKVMTSLLPQNEDQIRFEDQVRSLSAEDRARLA